MEINYSLLAPIAQKRVGKNGKVMPRRRAPGLAITYKEEPVGLLNPLTMKMQEIRTALHLTAKQLAVEMNAYYKAKAKSGSNKGEQLVRPITSEVLQSYFQGFVHTQSKIEEMYRILSEFAAHKIKDTLYVNKDMRGIINHWFNELDIDPSGRDGSPYRLLVEKISPYRATKTTRISPAKINEIGDIEVPVKGFDHTTIFRWYQGNRKPRSNLTIKEIDDAVNAARRH
jgi:hypothetical protein